MFLHCFLVRTYLVWAGVWREEGGERERAYHAHSMDTPSSRKME